MELLEIIYIFACWPFFLGLAFGGGLGVILSMLTTGEVSMELSAVLACIFSLLFTFLFGAKKSK